MFELLPAFFRNGFQFAAPWFLLLLIPVPGLLLLAGRSGDAPALTFSSLYLLERVGAPVRERVFGLTLSLFFGAVVLAVLALARPQLVSTYEKTSSNGIELIIALDVSRSMASTDFFIGGEKVTRLTAAKQVTREFIRERPSDRIGVVAFAGRPYLASPLTLDHDWLLESINRIRIGLVEDGTAIGSAIAMTAKRLDKRAAKSKIMVLLTDGSNNSGNLSPRDAARLARTLGIKIYAIAVGTPGEHAIPMPQGVVIHREEFDVETLQEVAQIGQGKYFRAQDTQALESIFSEINEMEKSDLRSRRVVELHELFPWFVLAGLLLAAGGLLVHECLPLTIP